jgi:hypothetical protein
MEFSAVPPYLWLDVGFISPRTILPAAVRGLEAGFRGVPYEKGIGSSSVGRCYGNSGLCGPGF